MEGADEDINADDLSKFMEQQLAKEGQNKDGG